MKKLLCLLASFALNISCTNAQEKQFSEYALAYKLTDVNGKEIPFKDILKKHEGKTVVIEDWASCCSDCVKNMPKLRELQTVHPNVDCVLLTTDKTQNAMKVVIKKQSIV